MSRICSLGLGIAYASNVAAIAIVGLFLGTAIAPFSVPALIAVGLSIGVATGINYVTNKSGIRDFLVDKTAGVLEQGNISGSINRKYEVVR